MLKGATSKPETSVLGHHLISTQTSIYRDCGTFCTGFYYINTSSYRLLRTSRLEFSLTDQAPRGFLEIYFGYTYLARLDVLTPINIPGHGVSRPRVVGMEWSGVTRRDETGTEREKDPKLFSRSNYERLQWAFGLSVTWSGCPFVGISQSFEMGVEVYCVRFSSL
jgi:hypothetical protein